MSEEENNTSYLQTVFRISGFTVNRDSQKFKLNNIAESYVKISNVVNSGVDFWIGRRWYDRRFFYMNEHFWLNVGQNANIGIGVENISIGSSKLRIALFHLKDEEVPQGEKFARVDSQALDFRLDGFPLSNAGHTVLWGNITHRNGSKSLEIEEKWGWGLGGWHQRNLGAGSHNIFAVMFRKGASMVQGPFNPRPVQESQGYDLSKAFSFEINNGLIMELPYWNAAFEWVSVFRIEKFGQRGKNGDTIYWGSTGIRGVYYLFNHIHAV